MDYTSIDYLLGQLYDRAYSEAQVDKFRNRYDCHWKYHIAVAKELTNKYCDKDTLRILDLGCSIGTYAIEFAIDGHETIGLDFDDKALAIASELAKESDCSPTWICADARNFELKEPVDVVVCFDLFEHLTDDIIEGALLGVFRNLKPGGVLIYHTFPTEYDHIFYQGGKYRSLPLLPFKYFGDRIFTWATKIYSCLWDLMFLIKFGKTQKGMIASTVHPNPLTPGKMKSFFQNSGFIIEEFNIGLEKFNPLKPGQGEIAKEHFSSFSIAQRSLWGVVRKPKH